MTTILCSDPVKLDLKRAHTVYKNADGKRVPSVTTILNLLNKPHLVKWANNLGLEGIDCEKVREEAADIGTIAHFMAECYVKGMTWDLSDHPQDQVARAENSFVKFVSWWDKAGYKLEASELKLVSERLQVGGTIDLVAIAPNGDRHLLDLKTSKAIYREYRIQTAGAYAPIYEEKTDNAIDDTFIIRIGKDEVGDFEVRQVFDRPQCEAAFESLRETYDRLRLVKD